MLALPLAATEVRAADARYYVGEIIFVLSPACPENTLEADGRKLDIREHAPLMALYGDRFGGDGKSSFALPDLRGKASLKGARYCA